MHATSIPQASQYFSQPNYTFYYTNSGQYCAYDAVSGDYFIHSLSDNRWYPYFPTESLPKAQNKDHGYFAAHEYATYDHSRKREARYRDGESNRQHNRRRDRHHREEFLYTPATAETARRSLLEEEIGMDYVYEEDLKMHGGVDWWNSTSFQHSRKARDHTYEERAYGRHHHRSGAQASPQREYAHEYRHHLQEDHHPVEHHARHKHQNQYQNHRHSSNKAYVGGAGSDHDSGYYDDFEPPEHPRNAMPGIAKWLDGIDDNGTVNGDYEDRPLGGEEPDLFEEHDLYAREEEYSWSRSGPRKPTKERYYNSQPVHSQQPRADNIYVEDLDMDRDYGTYHQSHAPPKEDHSHRRHSAYEGRENVIYQNAGEYDYYYEIPVPPPPPPPETDRFGRTPAKARTVFQPNSVYSGPESVRLPTYIPGLPRAPSPPLSPRSHRRMASGGEKVRYVRPEPKLRGRRTW